MIDTTQLTQLISAFRVETEKESISPETVGSLLQNITDINFSAIRHKTVQNIPKACYCCNSSSNFAS